MGHLLPCSFQTMCDCTSAAQLHEAGGLNTYALKVSFFKELHQQSNAKDWAWKAAPSRLANILNAVNTEGEDHSLTGYFIKDDPVLVEPDRSYLEIRRVKQACSQLNDYYFYFIGLIWA